MKIAEVYIFFIQTKRCGRIFNQNVENVFHFFKIEEGGPYPHIFCLFYAVLG